MLTLYFGVDIYSTTVTVATFMLGLGVGSLLEAGSPTVSRDRRCTTPASKSSWAASGLRASRCSRGSASGSLEDRRQS